MDPGGVARSRVMAGQAPRWDQADMALRMGVRRERIDEHRCHRVAVAGDDRPGEGVVWWARPARKKPDDRRRLRIRRADPGIVRRAGPGIVRSAGPGISRRAGPGIGRPRRPVTAQDDEHEAEERSGQATGDHPRPRVQGGCLATERETATARTTRSRQRCRGCRVVLPCARRGPGPVDSRPCASGSEVSIAGRCWVSTEESDLWQFWPTPTRQTPAILIP